LIDNIFRVGLSDFDVEMQTTQKWIIFRNPNWLDPSPSARLTTKRLFNLQVKQSETTTAALRACSFNC